MKTIYAGAFLTENLSGSLENVIENQHITFIPPGSNKKLSEQLLGGYYDFKIIGYANDGQNEGVLIELPEELKQFYHNENPPHITVSLAKGAKAVNTGKLNFELFPVPFNVKVQFGEFTNQGIIFEK